MASDRRPELAGPVVGDVRDSIVSYEEEERFEIHAYAVHR